VPAAAVIPAPIAYIKVVAVKKLVVGFRAPARGPPHGVHCVLAGAFRPRTVCARKGVHGSREFYFEEIRVFKAGSRLNTLAWNNGIGLWSYFVGF
jgi:hypothetical protein